MLDTVARRAVARPFPLAIPAVLVALALLAVACGGGSGGAQVGQGTASSAPDTTAAPGGAPTSTPTTATTAPAPARIEVPRPLKATWVHLFDDTLKTPAGVERVLDQAAAAGLDAVFVQVVRRHDAYYDSGFLPPTPDPGLEPGFDVLAAAVEGGHRRGLQVHAWFTVATAWHEMYRDLELPAGHVTREHGPGSQDSWMTVSHAGTQSPGYFDIGLPELHDHVAGIVTDIASRYAVDGVHLDYVRYDGVEWGYHPRALQRFAAETGYEGVPPPGEPRWADWRRAQSRAIVERARAALAQARPQALLSAAVIAQAEGPAGAPGGFAGTRAYADYAQDWAGWVSAGLLDLAVPMVYVRGHVAEQAQWFDQWLAFAAGLDQASDSTAVAVGVGGWLNTVAAGLAQARAALDQTAGVVVFSYQQDSSDASQGSFLHEVGGL